MKSFIIGIGADRAQDSVCAPVTESGNVKSIERRT